MPDDNKGVVIADGDTAPDRRRERLLLRPEEAAEALSIGRTKLYELLAAGIIPSVRIGSARRVPADALRQFVRSLSSDDRLRRPRAP